MSITDSDRLAYESPVISLSDGKQLQLHFGYGGLRRIEKHFGSCQAFFDKLTKGLDGEMFDTVFHGIFFGLWKTGITLEYLEANLPEQDMEKHIEALSTAVAMSFPKQAQAAASPQNGESPSESTGPTSFTSPQLSAVGANQSSGI